MFLSSFYLLIGMIKIRRHRPRRLQQSPEHRFVLPALHSSGLKGRPQPGRTPAPPPSHIYNPCCLHSTHAITIILPQKACSPCWKRALVPKFLISSGCLQEDIFNRSQQGTSKVLLVHQIVSLVNI